MFGIDDIVAGALPIAGGIASNILSAGDRTKQINAYKDAVAKIQALGAPPELANAIALKQLQSAGQLTPELQKAINQSQSQVASIQEDSATKQAEMQALQALQATGQNGLTTQDRAAYNKARTQASGDTTARLNSIIQNMRARGQGGSGAELAAKLSAAQGAANTESQAADEIAGQASQRALQAMTSAGNLGGSIRGQDFNVANTKAQAADELNRFNVQNQRAIQQQNVASQNQAQQYNLSNAQQISNANTQQGNAELQRQKQAQLQDYLNKAGYAGMQANADQQLGDIYGNQAQQTSNMFTGVGSGLGKLVGSYAQGNRNDQNFNKLLGYFQ